MPKCSFCHKAATEKFPLESNGLKEQYFCSEECKREIIEYIAAENKNTLLFLGILFGTILFALLAIGIGINSNERYGLLIAFIALSVIGATLIKFPYLNPMAIQMHGIKKSKILAKYMGMAFIIIGLVSSILTVVYK